MVEPTITCPECGKEIKLTESLAAPLIAATRRELKYNIARRDFGTSDYAANAGGCGEGRS